MRPAKYLSSSEYPSGFCPFSPVAAFSLPSGRFLFLGDAGASRGAGRQRMLLVRRWRAARPGRGSVLHPPSSSSPAQLPARLIPPGPHPHSLGCTNPSFVLPEPGGFHCPSGEENPANSQAKPQNTHGNQKTALQGFERDSYGEVLGLIQVTLLMACWQCAHNIRVLLWMVPLWM